MTITQESEVRTAAADPCPTWCLSYGEHEHLWVATTTAGLAGPWS